MKKLKILHLGNPDSFKNNYICKYLIERGHEVHFITDSEPNKPLKGIKYHILKANIIKFSKVRYLEFILKTRKAINKVRPDVLHAHHIRTGGWLGSFSGFHPLVFQCFGGDILDVQNWYHRLFTAYSLQKADKIIVTGKHMVDTLEGVFNIDRSKVEVLPRGIDLTVFKPLENKEVFLKKHKLSSGPIVFSPRYLLNHIYNIDVIIKSAPLVKKVFPEVKFIQLLKEPGDMKMFDSYVDLINRLGIKENFFFVPMVDNREMPEFYNAADVCVSIPKFDGFPVSVLEGSACGVPFIVSDVAYTREWFENGTNAIILREISSEALANATIDLLRDEKARKQMAAINMKKVQTGFDYYHCMAKLEEIYFHLVTCPT